MPGFVTHHLFGVKAYQQLENQEVKDMIRRRRHAFALGLQGPDLFFYFLPTASGLKPNIANTMHKEKTGRFFQALIDACADLTNEQDFEICCAYVHGFMGHYLLDTNIHPYVYAKVGTQTGQRALGLHFGLETDIDREVLYRYKGLPLGKYHHKKLVDVSFRETNVIASLLHQAIFHTYGLNISAALIKAAVAAFKFESEALLDPSGCKHRAVHFMEQRVFGYDFMSALFMCGAPHHEDPCNEMHLPWRNPWAAQKTSADSVFDIMERLKYTYASYMDSMQNALYFSYHLISSDRPEILDLLGNNSYTSGLDCGVRLTR